MKKQENLMLNECLIKTWLNFMSNFLAQNNPKSKY